jgi:hypothetical protein
MPFVVGKVLDSSLNKSADLKKETKEAMDTLSGLLVEQAKASGNPNEVAKIKKDFETVQEVIPRAAESAVKADMAKVRAKEASIRERDQEAYFKQIMEEQSREHKKDLGEVQKQLGTLTKILKKKEKLSKYDDPEKRTPSVKKDIESLENDYRKELQRPSPISKMRRMLRRSNKDQQQRQTQKLRNGGYAAGVPEEEIKEVYPIATEIAGTENTKSPTGGHTRSSTGGPTGHTGGPSTQIFYPPMMYPPMYPQQQQSGFDPMKLLLLTSLMGKDGLGSQIFKDLFTPKKPVVPRFLEPEEENKDDDMSNDGDGSHPPPYGDPSKQMEPPKRACFVGKKKTLYRGPGILTQLRREVKM